MVSDEQSRTDEYTDGYNTGFGRKKNRSLV